MQGGEAKPYEIGLDPRTVVLASPYLRVHCHRQLARFHFNLDLPLNLDTGSLNITPGTIIDGHYEIVSCLGQGGMGTVYKAFDRLKEKFVAIKLLNHEGPEDHKHVLRFKREAEATARLNHPSITKLLDFGLIDSVQPYLVMDFADGKTLSALIAEEGQLPLAETLPIFIAVCDGLAHAHENKVLHRDLKPSNIMINRDSNTTTVKILDFGIAKILESASTPSLHITHTGELLGSPFYMSPEQAKGGRIDHRSDLYSLGCTMYEALTGGPPHMGENPMSTLLKRESHEPPSLAEASLGRKFPEQLENIVAKLLKHNPNERYQSAYDLKCDLLKVGEQSEPASTAKAPIITPKPSDLSPAAQTDKIPKYVLALAAAVLFAGAFSASIAFLTLHEQKPVVPKAPEALATPQQENRGQESQAADTIDLSLIKRQASRLRGKNKFDSAEQTCLQAISDLSSAPGDNTQAITALRIELAWTYMVEHKNTQAARQYEQVLATYEKSFDATDPRIADIRNKLAENYRDMGLTGGTASLHKAVPLYEAAAKYYEQHLPRTSTELATCLKEEAGVLDTLRDLKGKERILLRLLKLTTAEFGDKHPETLTALEELGEVCRRQNKIDEAIAYDKKWVAAYNDSLDEPEPNHVKALLTLAFDYCSGSGWTNMSMIKTAEQLLTRGLKLCQRDPPRFERQTAQTLERLGVLYEILGGVDPGNYERAERCTLQAAAMYKQFPKFDKGIIADVIKRAAEIQINERHLDEAKATILEALKLRSKISGANSIYTIDIYWDLGEIYRRQGKLSEANKCYEQVLSLSKRYFGANSIRSGQILAGWAENTRIQGDFPKTRQLLIECLSIRRRALGPKHPETIWAEKTLNYINDCLEKPANSPTATPETSNH